MFTVKSNNHCISALRNLVGRTYLMVTLNSDNHCISALCNLMGRIYLMVTLKSNNHCILALCKLMGRTYLMVTLKSNNHCISAQCNLMGRIYLSLKKENAYPRVPDFYQQQFVEVLLHWVRTWQSLQMLSLTWVPISIRLIQASPCDGSSLAKSYKWYFDWHVV